MKNPPNRQGPLYIVSVPIGHPDDVTVRALSIFRDVDIIASENPAATRALLVHHGIDSTLTSYGPGNRQEKSAVLLERLRLGASVALVSDCGSPVVEDPGCGLIAAAHAQGIRVLPVPGASALIAAIMVSGFSADSFSFLGTLPRGEQALRRCFARHLFRTEPTLFFVPAGSLASTLDILARLVPRRMMAVAIDLTKPGEQFMRGTPHQIRSAALPGSMETAVTLVINGKRGPAGKEVPQKGKRKDQSVSSRRIRTRKA